MGLQYNLFVEAFAMNFDLGKFKLTLPEKRLLCGEENQYCGFLCLKPEKPDDILNILIKISPFDSYDIQMLGIS